MTTLSVNSQSQTSADDSWTKAQATKWFDKREWLNGADIKPHKSINKNEFAAQYHKHQEWWDKAFAFLKNTDLVNLKPGNYPIDGENVFAIVAENDKKDFALTKWESHRKYQDIQMVITGKEKMGKADSSKLTVTEPYVDAKDILFYSGDGEYFMAEPKTFFIFFPGDAHRPDIKVKGYRQDKKIVVKVRTDYP